jgi:pimeloyl-ACP methyl ester carboxylesterase
MPAYVRDNHPWFSVSLPGHFPSTLANDLRIEQIDARFFYEALDAPLDKILTDGEKAVLIGHSTGGFMALNYAAKNPERVAGVVSIGGFAVGEWTGLEGNLQKLARGNFLQKALFHLQIALMKLSPKIYRRAAGEYVTDKTALYQSKSFNETLEIIFPEIKKHTNRAMFYLFHQIPLLDISDAIPNIATPVLLMIGEKDPIIPLAHSLDLANNLPRAEKHLFKNTGHLPFVERQAEFSQTLTDWLKKISAKQ